MIPTGNIAHHASVSPSYTRFCRNWRMLVKERLVHPLTFQYWPGCVGVDLLRRAELITLQSRRLQTLLEHAIMTVPFYQSWAVENGFGVQRMPGLDRWPIVTKAMIRADPDAFQSTAYPIKAMRTAKTSGSTGEPFQLRVHTSSTDYSYACLWRALRRHGLRPGDRRVYVWGRSYQFNSGRTSVLRVRARQGVRNWLNNTLVINAYNLTNANVDQAIDEIEQFKPVYLHGYVSALYVIARRMLDAKRKFQGFTPTAVVTESEKLYDFQHKTMGEAFNCSILEHYGSVEFGNIAQADSSGLLRVSEDLFKLESLPGGELLVTNLLSQPYPMIRFRLGDLAIVGEPPANDSLPYGVLTEVIGRTVDLIPVGTGGYVHGVALAHVIDPHLKHVRKYQIHQQAIDSFVVRLASDDGVPEGVVEQIRTDLAKLVGPNVKIDVTQVDDIAPAKSGKFRWVSSDVSDVASLSLAEISLRRSTGDLS